MAGLSKYALLIIIVFSIILSYLIWLEQYDILIATIIIFILLVLLSIDFKFMVFYYLLFGSLTAPGFVKLGGVLGLNWIRNTALFIFYVPNFIN